MYLFDNLIYLIVHYKIITFIFWLDNVSITYEMDLNFYINVYPESFYQFLISACSFYFGRVNACSLRKYLAQLLMHSSVWLKLIFAQLSLPPCNLGHKTILLQKVFFLFWFTKQTLSRLDLEPHFSVSSKC